MLQSASLVGLAEGALLGLADGAFDGALDGDALGDVEGYGVSHRKSEPHTKLWQSLCPSHVCPTAHLTVHTRPPQSADVSSPFRMPSLHDGSDGACVGLVLGDSLGISDGLVVGLVLGSSVVG